MTTNKTDTLNNKDKNTDAGITKALTGIFGAFIDQSKSKSTELAKQHFTEDELTSITNSITDFDTDMFSYLTRKLEDTKEGALYLSGTTNLDVKFIFMHADFIESNFAKLIQNYEGSACSADKSRTIMRTLLRFYSTGNKIEWNYNAEYTYHLPKLLFTVHDDIVAFYEGIKGIYYGNPQKYLTAFQAIIASANAKKIEFAKTADEE